MGFDRFMSLALYAPGYGYYSGGLEKFGADGDFVTAPEISPLFGRCLARQVAQVLEVTGGDILELGAGNGKLARDMLQELDGLGRLPERYLILEVSQDLREKQNALLYSPDNMRFEHKISWIDEIPEDFCGVMVANEVLDAVPVHLLAHTAQGLCERGVVCDGEDFAWEDRVLPEGSLKAAASELDLPPGYVTEINPAACGLVASLSQSLRQGLMLLVDYGFPRREYYHPQRSRGTLMCHIRQMAHADPFWFPGLQDITAHVDFTAVAETGVANGLKLMGYTTQAQFLINCGITQMLQTADSHGSQGYLTLAAQAQKLLSPAEMGELFKIIALGKGMKKPLIGFTQGDKSYTL